MRSRADTRIVEPLDFEEAVAWSEQPDEPSPDTDDDLDWYLDDPELTQSIRAMKSGRGRTIALLLGAVAVLATALAVF